MYDLILSLKELIINAGEIAKTKRDTGLIIEYKEDNTIITNADKEISQFIYDNLRILTPNIPVICEERSLINLETNSFWLVDPIDSTSSYANGKDTYTINIALIKDGEPIIGLIYQPAISKLYYTNSDNQLKIEKLGINLPIDQLKRKDNYIAIASANNWNTRTKDFLEKNFINEVINIPSSIKLCLIAENVADIYPRFDETMEWDIAAGHALIKSTNGNIIDKDGKQMQYKKKNFRNSDFFACNSRWLNHKMKPSQIDKK